jgi:hypothetical protein
MLGKFSENEKNVNVFVIIGGDVRNHHLKKVVAFGYDIK